MRSSARILTFLGIVIWGTCSALGVTPAPDGGYAGSNTAEGENALLSLTTGTGNTAIGFHALKSDTIGTDNTAVGVDALASSGSGDNNTAVGAAALQVSTGTANTAIGSSAMIFNDSGGGNTAVGWASLFGNGSGNDNTAGGGEALRFNTAGSYNTASGRYALYSNTTGNYNVASGFTTLYTNNGNYNTATGAQSLYNNSAGSDNTADGGQALISNTSGSFNTAGGAQALYSNTIGHSNTSSGFNALFGNTSGSNNVAFGSNAGQKLTTGSNNIVVGANVPGVAGESNTIRIGKSGIQQKTFIAGIWGKTVASGTAVIINSQGQLGTVQSSSRFKEDILPMANASEALLKLKPVTFRYKEDLDPEKIPQFGLIAEEVEKVNPDLVLRDDAGSVTTVRYEAVNAMLLNEFLKEHRKLEEQSNRLQGYEASARQQEARITQQQQQIDLLTAAMQKVNACIELSQSTTRTAASNP
jgi:trimeric autotransporter adhesin